MDSLFIKIVDGQPVDNPVYESNLIQVYGYVPPEYQPFTRVQNTITTVTIYQNLTDTYQEVNGQWQDVWVISEQTTEEKAVTTAKINADGVAQQQALIANANTQIANLTAQGDTQGVETWNTYLASLNAWVMPPINPNWTQDTINYEFPNQPRLVTILNLGNGTGTFVNIETVYQSPDGTLLNSTCQATTQNFSGWTPGTTLPVTSIFGTFVADTPIFGYTSLAHYNYLSTGSSSWVIPT
jgi:hypothetical protein